MTPEEEVERLKALLAEAHVAVAVAVTVNPQWVDLYLRILKELNGE